MSFAPITPYAAAKVVNIKLARLGLEKIVTPQMMYSYAKNKRIETTTLAGDKKVYFDGDSFASWMSSYISATQSGSASTSYESLADQYM